mmetsp:Transcript_30744/g.80154  ORF Transcript_30744/g.80154 Transcript_30744/m.80154 type:complete len:207 (-) Transcript_30744:41-661(-)
MARASAAQTCRATARASEGVEPQQRRPTSPRPCSMVRASAARTRRAAARASAGEPTLPRRCSVLALISLLTLLPPRRPPSLHRHRHAHTIRRCERIARSSGRRSARRAMQITTESIHLRSAMPRRSWSGSRLCHLERICRRTSAAASVAPTAAAAMAVYLLHSPSQASSLAPALHATTRATWTRRRARRYRRWPTLRSRCATSTTR